MRARTLILTVTTIGSVAAILIASLANILIESPTLGSQHTIVSITQQNPLIFYGIAAAASPQPQSFDLLVTVDPVPALEDSDLKINVAISKTAFPEPEASVTILMETESFKILPNDVRTLALATGNSVSYIATPKGKGDKKLRVYAKYVNVADANNPVTAALLGLPTLGDPILALALMLKPTHVPELNVEKIINIQVLERPSFLGVTKEMLSIIQIVSAFLGIPSLLLLLATRRLDSRKSKQVPEDRSRIIVPK